MDKVKAIQFIRPEANFQIIGNELIWQDENQTEPTAAEIKSGLTAYQAAEQAEAEAKAQAKAQAEAKLLALGLSTDDLVALGLAQSL